MSLSSLSLLKTVIATLADGARHTCPVSFNVQPDFAMGSRLINHDPILAQENFGAVEQASALGHFGGQTVIGRRCSFFTRISISSQPSEEISRRHVDGHCSFYSQFPATALSVGR